MEQIQDLYALGIFLHNGRYISSKVIVYELLMRQKQVSIARDAIIDFVTS